MTFEIDVNGRTRTVVIERVTPADGRFRITVDERAHLVDVRRVNGSTLSLIFVDGGAASHEATVVATDRPGCLDVQLRGGVVRAVLNGRVSAYQTRGAATGAEGAQQVVAPMSGRVVRVLVAPGDQVIERQELIVVEAMKMENAIGSPKAGRVTDITVDAGTAVEAGRVLMSVE